MTNNDTLLSQVAGGGPVTAEPVVWQRSGDGGGGPTGRLSGGRQWSGGYPAGQRFDGGPATAELVRPGNGPVVTGWLAVDTVFF